MELLLTEQEQRLISQMAADSETGNHLLRPRSDEYKALCKKFSEIVNKKEEERTDKDKQMCEYYAACKDYDAYQKFIEKYELFVDVADGNDTPAMVMYKDGKVVKVKRGLDII